MTPKLEKLLAALSTEEKAELKKELGRTRARQRVPNDYSLNERIVWDAMQAAYRRHSLYISRDMDSAIKHEGIAKYLEFTQHLYEMMRAGLPEDTAIVKAQQEYILTKIIDCYLTWLKKRGFGCTLHALILRKTSVYEAFEDAYPGYIAARFLAKLIIK